MSEEIENQKILMEQSLQQRLNRFIGRENTIESHDEIVKTILATSKFKIICDETNNNEQTAKENRIVCDIEFYE